MKQKIQNYIIITLLIIIVFLLITLILTYRNSKEKNKVIMTNQLTDNELVFEQGISDDIFGPITDEKVIQKITIRDIDISCIGIKFATYDRINDAIYRISLKENDKYIVKYDFNTNLLVNGDYTYFRFREIHLNKKNKYEIIIQPINISEGNIITVFSNNKTKDITYSLYN